MGTEDPRCHSRYRARAFGRQAQSQQRHRAGVGKIVSQRTWVIMRASDSESLYIGEYTFKENGEKFTYVSSVGSKLLRRTKIRSTRYRRSSNKIKFLSRRSVVLRSPLSPSGPQALLLQYRTSTYVPESCIPFRSFGPIYPYDSFFKTILLTKATRKHCSP